MFKKTLIQLTILNTALLILLIGAFGMTIFIYEQGKTFRDSNHMLEKNMNDKEQMMQTFPESAWIRLSNMQVNPDAAPQRGPALFLTWVIYDQHGKKILSSLDGQYTGQSINQFFKLFQTKRRGIIVEKKIGNNYFHILSENVKVNNKQYVVSANVQVTTEKRLLHELLVIIVDGILLGALVSIVFGYFLARRALRPIEAAWEKQNRFVADASHELRTPLSILQLKIESLLQQPKRRIQETGEDIAVMLDETRRLSKLVGSLLTLARSDADRLEVILAPLDLKKLILKVTEPFAEMAEIEGKKFQTNLDEQPLNILGDEQRLHQLLVILLDNAMKFTPESGEIKVSCRREAKFVCLAVSNSGAGISEKDLPHVFERFYQADSSRGKGRGTGLGLSIAEWIVRRHRGKIEVQSRTGQETKFIIRLPLRKKETGQLLLNSVTTKIEGKHGKTK